MTAGAFKICGVKSNLQGVRQEQLVLKHKRGTCFSRGYRFFVCQFDIRVIVAPADLRFELWFAGEKFSGNHELQPRADIRGLGSGRDISKSWVREGAYCDCRTV